MVTVVAPMGDDATCWSCGMSLRGLTVAMLNRLCFAVDELEKVSGEVLETVGNGS